MPQVLYNLTGCTVKEAYNNVRSDEVRDFRKMHAVDILTSSSPEETEEERGRR
jgi:hypothetical protein